jgi:hypothetical protein
MPHKFLDLLKANAFHRKPTCKGVAEIVPGKIGNPGFRDCVLKPVTVAL